MRRHPFLSKLAREGVVRLVQPSESVKDSYVKKSEEYLSSAKLLLEKGKLETPVSLAYYSMYYSALALLFSVGIKCENHSAALILLDNVFGIDTRDLAKAKTERIDKQYYVGFSIAKVDVEALIMEAERFNSETLDFIDRLNNERIEGYRKTLKMLL